MDGNFQQALDTYQRCVTDFNEYFAGLQEANKRPQLIDSDIGKIFASHYLASCYWAIGNGLHKLQRPTEAVSYLYACLDIAERTTINIGQDKIAERIDIVEANLTPQTPFPTPSHYWIYIPQARTGRLSALNTDRNIAGLYTDNFYSCIVVVFRNTQRLSLTHLDHMLDPTHLSPYAYLINELHWVTSSMDKNYTATVYFRPIGQFNVDNLKSHLSTMQQKYESLVGSSIHFSYFEVKDATSGLTAHVTEGIRFTHSTRPPQNMLYHPQHLQFNTAHKIEELFYSGNASMLKKQPIIFDGRGFVSLPKEELTPHLASKQEQQDFAQFDPQAAWVTTMKVAHDILMNILKRSQQNKTTMPIEHVTSIAALYIMQYHCNHDPVVIFRKNLTELIEQNQERLTLTDEDTALVKDLNLALSKPESAMQECNKIICALEPSNPFQKDLASEFKRFRGDYTHLQNIHRHFHEAKQAQKKADTLCEKAKTCLVKGDYNAAANLYFGAYENLCNSICREEAKTIEICERLAFCNFRQEDYTSATRYAYLALSSTQTFDPNSKTAIARLTKLFEDCRKKSNISIQKGVGLSKAFTN